jgi:hypothetical protein
MDGCKDTSEQITRNCHLSKLERDGAGVTDDPCTDFDQPGLQAGQRPVCNLLGQISAFQEDTEVVGQCMKLKPHLVLGQSLTGETRPVDRLLAFLDALPGSVCLHTREGAALPCRADCRTVQSSPAPSAGW